VTEEIVVANQPDLTKDDDLNTKLQKSVDRIGNIQPKANIGKGFTSNTVRNDLSKLAKIG
jgi:hypothetical protein